MIKEFLLTLVVFLGIDFVWLGLIARRFYDQQLALFSRTVRWPPAFLSYLLLVFGLNLFVLGKKPPFWWGAAFGLVAYGVYDLVNLATLTNWTLKMTIVDMLWGGLVCGLVSLIVSVLLK